MNNDLKTTALIGAFFISLISCATNAAFNSEKVADNIYMLSGYGGNIAVVQGSDGLLIIDNGLEKNQRQLMQAIEAFEQPLSYTLNTHFHADHSGTNHWLGTKGAIIAHDNVRKRLIAGEKSKSALPVITYSDKLAIYFNDYTFNIEYSGVGHTDGDSIIYIEPANVVHLGDHFFSGYFPFIDVNSGGSLEGYINNVQQVLNRIDKGTKIIPGHGKLSNKQDLAASLAMLQQTKAIVKSYIEQGLSLQQSIDKGLPKKWQPWGVAFITEARWITFLYRQLVL